MKVIVVDDSRTIRTIIKRTLAASGFEVVEAADGLEALEVVKESWPVDLALVDWNMPNMNGLELVEALRAAPEYSALKIMMVTTESEVERVEKAMEAGADEYLMKPFQKEALHEKLSMMGILE